MEYRYGVPHHATMSPLLEEVGEGNIDCSLIPLVEIPHLVPLSQGLTLNYLTYKPDTLALAAGSLYNTFTPLREEWEVANNAKALYALPMDTLALCTTSPVSGVADLEGLKIGGYGRSIDTLKRLGAEPILVPSSEIYEAVKQEVIAGTLHTLEAISSLKLFEVAEYLTEPWAGPDRMLVTVINRDVWDSLPADIKDLMESLSEDALNNYLQTLMEDNRKAIKEMVTAGVNFSVWLEYEREIAQERVQPAQAQDWIEEVGTSGQELISRLQEKLAVYETQRTYQSGFEIWQEEYGVPSPGLLFEDDFSNPSSGWPRESEEVYEFDYENDEYHILMKKSNWAAWASNKTLELFTDFTLEIDARLLSGPTQSLYGVVFRLQDNDNLYRFLVWGDGHYLVGTKLNGKWTVLQSKTKSAFINQGNSTNHFKVVCEGSKIEVYVNGHYLTTVTDDSLSEGYMGVIVDTPQANTHVSFDNLRVYSLD